MKLQKRQYELKAVTNLRKDLAEHGRVIAVSPTGSGKTVIASMLIRREKRWKKVLWLAHRYELIDQAYETLAALGLDVGIRMDQEERLHGDARVNPKARVQVGSVQTIGSRGVPKGVDLIVFDEAHHVAAESWQAIAKKCKKADVLGLTATPGRTDGKPLGEFFDHMRILATQKELQREGYIANPRTYSSGRELRKSIAEELKHANSKGGDYTEAAMSRAVDRDTLIGNVVSEAMRIAPRVPKVVFACSVQHSMRLCAGFEAQGVTAAHIDAKTPADEREAILADLRAGVIEVVCNVGVLCEGWDLPELGAVILARPTKSLVLYLQMTGRVQRHFGEAQPFVIDHGNNVFHFGLLPGMDVEWLLDHGTTSVGDPDDPKLKECPKCSAVVAWGVSECPECGAALSVERTPREEREEIEARLEEVRLADLEAEKARIRAHVDDQAKKLGAPKGWAEKVAAKMIEAQG